MFDFNFKTTMTKKLKYALHPGSSGSPDLAPGLKRLIGLRRLQQLFGGTELLALLRDGTASAALLTDGTRARSLRKSNPTGLRTEERILNVPDESPQ